MPNHPGPSTAQAIYEVFAGTGHDETIVDAVFELAKSNKQIAEAIGGFSIDYHKQTLIANAINNLADAIREIHASPVPAAKPPHKK